MDIIISLRLEKSIEEFIREIHFGSNLFIDIIGVVFITLTRLFGKMSSSLLDFLCGRTPCLFFLDEMTTFYLDGFT